MRSLPVVFSDLSQYLSNNLFTHVENINADKITFIQLNMRMSLYFYPSEHNPKCVPFLVSLPRQWNRLLNPHVTDGTLGVSSATVHLVDVWNMIEAFRDNGLNTLDHNAEINVSRLETILSSIYYQLNKRLPTTHQINVEQSIGLLLNFMVATYDRYTLPG